MIVALSGGVGGAKLCRGFDLNGEELAVVVNTADDFEHLGLHIAPDLDSVTYALAGWADPERGWGVREESWHFLETLEAYGAPTWFALGDRDLAAHVLRTGWLKSERTLTEATAELARRLGLRTRVLPMSDDPVRTRVRTTAGWLDFQEYFVKERCQPEVTAVAFEGIEAARPTAAVLDALAGAEGIVLCPSNPLVSLDPILGVPGLREALRAASAPVVGVSPLIAGRAVKGPTVAMLRGLGLAPTPAAVAARYADVLDAFVLDARDAESRAEVASLGLRVALADTWMRDDDDKRRVAAAAREAAR